MSPHSRRLAGILLVIFPTIVYGGGKPAGAADKRPRSIRRTRCVRISGGPGTPTPGCLLILALVCLRYVDEARLPERLKGVVREAIPLAAILLPIGFFLSVLSPDATQPNAFIYCAYAGAVSLTFGLLTLGIGLLRARAKCDRPKCHLFGCWGCSYSTFSRT